MFNRKSERLKRINLGVISITLVYFRFPKIKKLFYSFNYNELYAKYLLQINIIINVQFHFAKSSLLLYIFIKSNTFFMR